MVAPPLLFETDGPVATLTLNRPEKMNAIDSATLRALRAGLDRIAAEDALRAVVVRGAGDRAFSAGADIGEMLALSESGGVPAYMDLWMGALRGIEALPKPVIASVQGYATAGGTELALACDLVLCAEDARFSLAEIKIGVIPGAGAALRLTRAMGRHKAKELLMLGDFVSGADAGACGLANRCVPRAELAAVTADWAARLAAGPPLALAAAKRLVNGSAERPLGELMDEGLAAFLHLFESGDQKEGMRAFLEKRPAVYRGR
jgi:enoyl-CoA hydratase/carnithine racemase